jgi:hypothetical protein
MKNALISPNELVYDDYTSQLLGWRVAQVEPDQPFSAGDICFWMPCADDVVADFYYYDPNTLQILPKPSPPTAGQTVSSGTQVV